MRTIISVPAQFRGPPNSVNGGYACGVMARLIVRRVKRLNPKAVPQGQDELFAVYRFHAVFTDSTEPMLLAPGPPP